MVRPRLFAFGLFLFAAGFVSAEPPGPASGTLVLKGALVRTQTEAGDFVGTLVIRDGKIVAVGRSIAIPGGAKIIDVAGCVITPGLIDAHGMLGLHSSSLNEGGR